MNGKNEDIKLFIYNKTKELDTIQKIDTLLDI